jgi:hypothetical protein
MLGGTFSSCVPAAATQEQRITMLSQDGEARLTRCDGGTVPCAAKPGGVREDTSWGEDSSILRKRKSGCRYVFKSLSREDETVPLPNDVEKDHFFRHRYNCGGLSVFFRLRSFFATGVRQVSKLVEFQVSVSGKSVYINPDQVTQVTDHGEGKAGITLVTNTSVEVNGSPAEVAQKLAAAELPAAT